MDLYVPKVITILAKKYPGKGMTDLGRVEDTLIATMLSARTRDDTVVRIFPAFRKRFPDWTSIASAPASAIRERIASVNFCNVKAVTLKKLAQMMVERFDGKVPGTMQDLTSLPGIGRKTASVILSFCFGVPAIAVDTHVFRIVRRLGWSSGKTPEAVEHDLMGMVPKRLWNEINRAMVPFGRDVCRPRVPKCGICPVRAWCKTGRRSILSA